jgi:hypothetical protein
LKTENIEQTKTKENFWILSYLFYSIRNY